MAFGKDQSHLGNIPAHGGTYVQRMRYATRKPDRGSRNRGAFYWKDTYDPPDLTTDIVRLIPGAYTQEVSHDGESIVQETFEYVMYREHYNGKRGCICSGGALWANKEKAMPCPSCSIFWEDWRERAAKKNRGDNTKGPNRMSCRDQFAFNVWDYGLYFEMPEIDGRGQVRMNQKTNTPFTHWVKGAANDPQFQNRPWKQGDLRPWPMPTHYKDALLKYAVHIGAGCVSCSSKDSIRCIMKTCGNPACGEPIYDPNNCTLNDEQREALESKPFKCQRCGQEAFIGEKIECSRCPTPKRASIFDVDMQVQKMGTKGQKTYLQVINWSEPRPIQVFDQGILSTIKPLNLLERFAPMPPAAQMQLFGLTVEVPTHGPMAPPIIGQQPSMPVQSMAIPQLMPMPQQPNYQPPQYSPPQPQSIDQMPAMQYPTYPGQVDPNKP